MSSQKNITQTLRLVCARSHLIQELLNSEAEFVKEIDVFTLHHLTQAASADAPAEVSSQKEAIFRNIDDIKCFHHR